MITDVLLDSISDALVIFPFLFLVYTFMEMVESAKSKEKLERALSGKYAPLVSAATGVVPECGFSVMCAKFFDGGFIAFGTLIAAFIATSDEGVIILLSEGASAKYAVILVAIKIIYAAFIGVLLNLIFGKYFDRHVCPLKDDCVECGEHHGGFFDKFVSHPFYHAAKTFLYLLAVNVLLNFIFELIGEDNIFSFISSKKAFEPIFTALLGLIPNCASSIFLARGFTYNLISFSGLIAGLGANSGVGMLILLKNGRKFKRNALIILTTYIAGVLLGYIVFPIS